MGALEALNGMLLFGMTTAFLFAMIQKVWPLGSRGPHRDPLPLIAPRSSAQEVGASVYAWKL
jgi:hypothetical protein